MEPTPARRAVRTSATVSVAAAALLGLAACDGGTDNPPTTTTSSPATPSTTTTTTVTTTKTNASMGVPDAAQMNTAAGAQAFVLYFSGQHAKAWQTPDPSALAGLCLPSAKTCSAFIDSAQDLKSKGQHLDRAPIVLRTVSDMAPSSRGRSVLLTGTQTPAKIVNRDGTVSSVTPTKPVSLLFELHWGSGWRVVSIKLAA